MNADVIPLEQFDANGSIDLWWQDKRRLNQRPRKPYKKRKNATSKPSSSTALAEDVIDVETTSESESESFSDRESHEESTSESGTVGF